MRFSKISRGFSLIEMLIVMALGVVLLSLALPGWQSLYTQSASESLRKQLASAFAFARQQALLRHAVVTICPSADQETCSGSWQQGWIVVIDEHQILRAYQATPTKGTLCWRAFPNNRPYYQFLPSGSSLHSNASFQYFAPKMTRPAWAIILNQSGRLRSVYPA